MHGWRDGGEDVNGGFNHSTDELKPTIYMEDLVTNVLNS